MGGRHDVSRGRVIRVSNNLFAEALTLCRASFALYTHVPADVSVYLPNWIVRINMWHGTPIKYILDDTPKKLRPFRRFKRRVRNQDPKQSHFFLSGGKRFTEIMQVCTGFPPERILTTGLPRNNGLYQAAERGHTTSGIALLAPTFRDRATQENRIESLVKAWEPVFRQRGMVLHIKLHPNDKTDLSFAAAIDWVRICDSKIDINRMLIKSDLLISDYSSVVFDYLILKRPVYLLMDDIADYLLTRGGTYIKTTELESIFDCHTSADSLVSAILGSEGKVFEDLDYLYNQPFDIDDFLHQLPKIQQIWSGKALPVDK